MKNKMIVAIAVVGLFAAAAACSSKSTETSEAKTDSLKNDTVKVAADTTKKDSSVAK